MEFLSINFKINYFFANNHMVIHHKCNTDSKQRMLCATDLNRLCFTFITSPFCTLSMQMFGTILQMNEQLKFALR